MIATPHMGLTVWNLGSDEYDHSEQAANWNKVDEHDHSTGKGVQIPTSGIIDGAVTYEKLGDDLKTLLGI